jgi:hypothetical protein
MKDFRALLDAYEEAVASRSYAEAENDSGMEDRNLTDLHEDEDGCRAALRNFVKEKLDLLEKFELLSAELVLPLAYLLDLAQDEWPDRGADGFQKLLDEVVDAAGGGTHRYGAIHRPSSLEDMRRSPVRLKSLAELARFWKVPETATLRDLCRAMAECKTNTDEVLS